MPLLLLALWCEKCIQYCQRDTLTWSPVYHSHTDPQCCYRRQAALSPSRTTVTAHLLLGGMFVLPQYSHHQAAAGKWPPHEDQTVTHMLWAGFHNMALHLNVEQVRYQNAVCIMMMKSHFLLQSRKREHGALLPLSYIFMAWCLNKLATFTLKHSLPVLVGVVELLAQSLLVLYCHFSISSSKVS